MTAPELASGLSLAGTRPVLDSGMITPVATCTRDSPSVVQLHSAAGHGARLLVVGVLWACSGKAPPDYVDEQVTDVYGGTCGEWQISAPEDELKRVHVDCGEGLECRQGPVVYPEKQAGNRYGQCLPADAVCDVTSDLNNPIPCPDERHSCYLGFDARPPGQCFYRCSVPQDCPGPFQTCEFGRCTFVTCSDGDCSGSNHCENKLCVPD